MKFLLKREKYSSILYKEKFYDTGEELDLEFSDVFRLSRLNSVIAKYDFVPYDPLLWKNQKFINFYGDIDLQSGFGNVSYYLLKESSNTLQIAYTGRTYGVNNRVIFSSQNRPLNQAGAMIWHDQPRERWLESPFEKNIAIVPWETTQIPNSWVHRINSLDVLLTCCNQNIQAFRDSGITVPIELIHWAIDPERFYPLERLESKTFTFGTMGALSYRKGTELLVEAFQEEFPRERDVKLICKTSYNTYSYDVKNKRIEVQITPVTPEELLSGFFQKIDCFVFPTRGEGFGLPALEAMATGVPVIVTNWSGPCEYMNKDVGWLIDYKMVPAKKFSEQVYKEYCGDWAEPNKQHLRQLMRYAYSHRDEVKQKGQVAAEYARQNWLWKDKIKMFHQALNSHL